MRRATFSDLPAIRAVQRASYAPNREILGVEPLPLMADYASIMHSHEVYLLEDGGAVAGVLVLAVEDDALLIWSVATSPQAQGRGHGNAMLAFAEREARARGLPEVRLYTGEKLTGNIEWYKRKGFHVAWTGELPDRRVVHMSKAVS